MLESLDKQLFVFLNSLHSPAMDVVMYAISGKLIWAPLYIAILIWLGNKYKRKFLVILVFIILAVTLADQLSVLIKNHVHRLRPCHDPTLSGIVHIVNNECGGLYSYVSSHATNSFNVALLSLLLLRKRWFTVTILIWAAIVSYSRIYLGVHFPGDVFSGAILGCLTGWAIYSLYNLTDKIYLEKKAYFNQSVQHTESD